MGTLSFGDLSLCSALPKKHLSYKTFWAKPLRLLATLKLVTPYPLVVYRIFGSRPRLPMTIIFFMVRPPSSTSFG